MEIYTGKYGEFAPEVIKPGCFYWLKWHDGEKENIDVIRVSTLDNGRAALVAAYHRLGEWRHGFWCQLTALGAELGEYESRAYRLKTRAEALARIEEIDSLLKAMISFNLTSGYDDYYKGLMVEQALIRRLWAVGEKGIYYTPARLLGTLKRGAARQELWEYKTTWHTTVLRLKTDGKHKDFQYGQPGYLQMKFSWLRQLVNTGVEWTGQGCKGQQPTVRQVLMARQAIGYRAKIKELRTWITDHNK